MKFFKVSIDNNPGGWKQGSDPSTIVIAENKEEAIEKVKNGWWSKTDYDNNYDLIYSEEGDINYVRNDSDISACEVKFELEGYTIEIKNIRKSKLDKINERSKENKD